MKKKYLVNGMSCSACSASVERVVKKVNGVSSAVVNLTMKLLVVDGENFKDADVLLAIKKAGFKGEILSLNNESKEKNSMLFTRLIPSLILALIFFYILMGENLYLPYPKIISKTVNPVLFSSFQLLLAILCIIINNKFFINGVKAIFKGSMNMDTLISFGSSTAFIYSAYIFVLILINNNAIETFSLVNDLRFESVIMILTLITIGKTIEDLSKRKTQKAVNDLKKLAPTTATIFDGSIEREISIKELKVGDIVVIKNGASIPCDCKIIYGECEVNESSLTGESLPIYKGINDTLKTATVLTNGYVKARVEAVNEDTIFSKIIDSVINAQSTKIPMQRLADKISGIFVPFVLSISLITFLIWFLISKDVNFSLNFAISVLVVSCPCALGLATPVAITVATGKCAKNGILMKNAEVLENISLVKNVFLDKTGTITTGKIKVDSVIGLNEEEKRRIACLEKMTNHLISTAIVDSFPFTENIEITNFQYKIGSGVLGEINGDRYYVGKERLDNLNESLLNRANDFINEGKTVVYCHKNDKLIGIISLVDEINKSSFSLVNELKNLGIKTIILSGDSDSVCKNIQKSLKVDYAFGNCLPEDKAKIIQNFKNEDKSMFIGDGVNDSVALSTADIGVALSSGTDMAVDFSDVVLLKNDLTDVTKSIKIGKKTRRIIKQNLFWAFFYNVLAIPLACGVLYYPLGLTLNPIVSAFCMSLSSIFVILNALRLFK